MTGLEPIVVGGVAVAGKALPAAVTKIVASIGLKLVKSWSLRWRLARRVKRDTGISFQSKFYRNWLKLSAAENLRKPVNETGANLAISLDEMLSNDRAWLQLNDRRSKALELVKATYLAVVALADAGESELLQESWAKSRHDELLMQLAQTSNGRQFLNRTDRGALLLAESFARRRRRLAALGIREEQVEGALSILASSTPVIEPGKLVIIIGSFGAGKSELAETWIRQRITDYKVGLSLAVPVWLHATDLINRTLEESLSHHIKPDENCAVVVDGLDEVDSQVAARIVERVGVYVETNNQSKALLTSRHGVLPESNEQQTWGGVTADQARQLIESVSGKNHATWDWNPMLVESVRRPFFAIGAGVLLAEGERAFSQADLVRRLVELALGKPSSATPSVQDSEKYQLLKKASVNLVSSGGKTDGLRFQERQQILTTRLVASAGSIVEFTLPIFQQWFAAQDLLVNRLLLQEAASTSKSFDRWRWALSITGLSAQSAKEFDEFAQILMQTNPGAAAWVLDQIASARDWPSREANDFVEANNAGARVLLATRTWIDAMGVLAPNFYPLEKSDQPIALRVGARDGAISVVWDRTIPETDTVEILNEDFSVDDDYSSWRRFSSGGTIRGYEWPWAMQQENISKGMAKALETAYCLGPVGGVLHNESCYGLARVLAGDQSIFFKPLNRLSISKRIGQILGSVKEPEKSRFEFAKGTKVEGGELIDFAEWVESVEEPTICRPLPMPDQGLQEGWVWDVYSDERLLNFVAEAYGQACVAYDEARNSVFADFDWSMGTGVPGGFGVIAFVQHADNTNGWAGGPRVTLAVVPIEVVVVEANRFGRLARSSHNGRALVVDRSKSGVPESREAEVDYFMGLTEGLPARNDSAFDRRSVASRSVDFTSHSRPASEIAINWIWKDLEALKIAKGSAPRFR
ncbi:hypothetical protein ACTXPA_03305 [Glutamicibacter arilaitensis]|uniref:hypothetical protein n=1 Tax=Glutamicibacter arilaitensis TaxID=256701 RepID=UPI003FD2749D